MQKRGWFDREMDKEYEETLLKEIRNRDKEISKLNVMIGGLCSVIVIGGFFYFF